jgi:hypothetical protein
MYVDFLPQEALRLPGRLGITLAPGKSYEAPSGPWDRDLHGDLTALRRVIGTDVLVTLLEPFEMHMASIPHLRQAAERMGMESLALPIPDMGIPHALDAAAELVETMVARVEEGLSVVVHCMGGLGRAGTIAACCVAARGHTPEAAIAIVRKARPGTIQTPTQEGFVARFAATVRCPA